MKDKKGKKIIIKTGKTAEVGLNDIDQIPPTPEPEIDSKILDKEFEVGIAKFNEVESEIIAQSRGCAFVVNVPPLSEKQQYEKESPNYYAAKYKELEDLPGVGPAIAANLRKAGINTVKVVMLATTHDLMKAGLGEETALKLLDSARKTLGPQFVSGDELAALKANVRNLNTGVLDLNKILGGGPPTQSITEFFGEFGTGKSQLCHQLCLTAQLPEEKGGLGGKVLYIDTENIFRPERVMQINEKFNLEKPLEGIIVAEAYTSEHQVKLLDAAASLVQEENIRVIIVDSLTSHFRSEYLGREMLAPRQQLLNQHMHKLLKMAIIFDIAVVVTNQVSAEPTAFMAGVVKPVGGHIVGHMSHTRVYLRKASQNARVAKVVASPFLPDEEAVFMITKHGCEDIPS